MEKPAWGMIVLLDLFNCDEKIVRTKKSIKDFPKEVCRIINMIPYGDTFIKRFGSGGLEGYSAFQFIETSSIVVHADEKDNRVFVDVFSCKDFDPISVIEFSKEYFKSDLIGSKVVKRGELRYQNNYLSRRDPNGQGPPL